MKVIIVSLLMLCYGKVLLAQSVEQHFVRYISSERSDSDFALLNRQLSSIHLSKGESDRAVDMVIISSYDKKLIGLLFKYPEVVQKKNVLGQSLIEVVADTRDLELLKKYVSVRGCSFKNESGSSIQDYIFLSDWSEGQKILQSLCHSTK
jgi:hypothetical protein